MDHQAPHDAQALVDDLLREDAAINALARDNSRYVQRIEQWLLPSISLRLAERDLLARRLERSAPVDNVQIDRLRAELLAARHEIVALRASWSWRVTAPLRRAYAWLWGGRRTTP